MRAGLALDIFQQCVVDEMKVSDPNGTVGIRKFLTEFWKLYGVFSSFEKLSSPADPRMAQLLNSLQWLEGWRHESRAVGQSQSHKIFLSHQLFVDVVTAIKGFKGLVSFIDSRMAFFLPPLYVCPKTINQDFLEGYFGLQRSTSGCTQNMTCRAYGYNGLSLQQTHVIGKNLGTSALQMPLTPHHRSKDADDSGAKKL